MPPQTGLTGGHATNEEDETITLTGTVHGIESTKSGLCGSGESQAGEQHLNVKVGAHNELGEPEGITLSHAG